MVITSAYAVFNTNINLKTKENIKVTDESCFTIGSLEELTLNEGLEEIGFEAFSYNNLKTINIPNTVEEIDNEFIYNNKKLKTVNIGSGIKIIHDNAFYRIGNNEELTININKKENQIEGAPWNGENIKVNWLG